MINDVDNEVQVSNKDLIIIYKCGFFKGPAYLFRQRTGLRRVIRGLFGIRVLFLDGIIGWIPGLFNPPPPTVCSKGFYVDISNQRQMQQCKSCLKSILVVLKYHIRL